MTTANLPAGAAGFECSGPDDAPVLSVVGEIDVATAPALRDELYRLIDRGARTLTVDLAGVEFVDSAGLGALVGALKRLREQNGNLVVRGVRPPARRVFEITGLTRLFTMEE